MIHEIKILFLKINKYKYLSDIATQFRVDKVLRGQTYMQVSGYSKTNPL